MQGQKEPSILIKIEEEIKRIHLISSEYYSHKLIIYNLIPLLEKIIEITNPLITEAYLTELIPTFLNSINNTTLEGISPEQLESIRNILSGLSQYEFLKKMNLNISSAKEKVDKWSEMLNLVLSGETDTNIEDNIQIPLLETSEQDEITLGVLENLTVKITKRKDEDKFLIVPSEKDLEQMLDEQIKISWTLAKNYCEQFVRRIKDNHEVVIHFNRRSGLCRGNSLGLALTINFIEELLKFYNPAYIVQAQKGIAITGGLDKQGKLLPVGDEIIKLKTELVFFSTVEQLVVPKHNEFAAREKLDELKLKYPERILRVIAVEDLEDLLNRRNIVRIKKINPIVRTAKFARRNVFAVLMILLLTSLFTALLTIDLDDNPSYITLDGKKAYIKNKNGKILFNFPFLTDNLDIDNPVLTSALFKIVDIDSDGDNEIIYVADKLKENTKSREMPSIRCVDKSFNTIWSYSFLDTVYSEREMLLPPYDFTLIDTATINGRKVLLFCVNNGPSFSTAISGIELSSGIRIKNTFWGSGHTLSAIKRDINNDGQEEIVAVGIDNGFEDAVVWGIELNKLDGYRPTTKEYQIKGFKEADLIFYLRIPKQDVDKYLGIRNPSIWYYSLNFREYDKSLSFEMLTIKNPGLQLISDFIKTYIITIDSNLTVSDVVVISSFRVFRDSLVAQGKLNPPYTDTKEYKEIIKNSVLYWKNGKWVKREEWEK
ncbi:MAG: hypothetical protein ACK4R9_10820 [Ignavibacterium sp.]